VTLPAGTAIAIRFGVANPAGGDGHPAASMPW